MNRFASALLAAFLVWGFAGLARAEPEAPQPPQTFDLKAIDDYVARQVKDRGFVGLSLAVARDGKVVLAKGYGKSSLEAGTVVEPDTLFAVGSVTKQFTCACVLLLAEEGKLSVQDKVAKYYPNLTRARDVTLYDLMTHTSGYPDYYPLDFVDRRLQKPVEPDKLIEEYAGGKLDFEPGTRWSYSNTGYTILGRVVEKVSGEAFGKFLERRILKPLGMRHSAFLPEEGDKRLARPYTSFALGPPEVARREAEGWLYAAGGLYSTASDLAEWDLALVGGKVLKPESYQLMTAPRKLASGKMKDYGCGLTIVQREGETVLRHGGSISGFLAYNAVLPRTKSAVVLLTNGDFVEGTGLQADILALLLKDQGAAAEVPKVQGPPAKDAALELLHAMQKGAIDRAKLGEEFSHYLDKEKLEGAAARLKGLGEPAEVEVEATHERGGMEVAFVRMTFKSAVLRASLYRTPDGKIQQFLIQKGE
jgi:CubicO group peptidase (beta-lactamase class C family)